MLFLMNTASKIGQFYYSRPERIKTGLWSMETIRAISGLTLSTVGVNAELSMVSAELASPELAQNLVGR